MWDFILFGVLFGLIALSIYMLTENQIIQISDTHPFYIRNCALLIKNVLV
jgi:Flp pilus assembly protein TadG